MARPKPPVEKASSVKINCSEETFVEWKRAAAHYRDYEAFLKDLLSVFNAHPELFTGRFIQQPRPPRKFR